jgi:hypothetical protein
VKSKNIVHCNVVDVFGESSEINKNRYQSLYNTFGSKDIAKAKVFQN